MSFSKSLKEKSGKIWEDCYNHPFLQDLGKGVLAKDVFKFYMVQDYKYLLEYAKVFALGAIKAPTEELMSRFTTIQNAILSYEMDLHRQYMQELGITPDQAEKSRASLFNRAYTANMLAVAQAGGLLELLLAVFPCAWTYYDYACRLKKDYAEGLENNFYKSWIEKYASDSFYETFEWFYPTVDELCRHKTAAELAKLEDIFISSVEFEYMFWDMAYKQQLSY